MFSTPVSQLESLYTAVSLIREQKNGSPMTLQKMVENKYISLYITTSPYMRFNRFSV